jgi:hypothetical protein
VNFISAAVDAVVATMFINKVTIVWLYPKETIAAAKAWFDEKWGPNPEHLELARKALAFERIFWILATVIFILLIID